MFELQQLWDGLPPENFYQNRIRTHAGKADNIVIMKSRGITSGIRASCIVQVGVTNLNEDVESLGGVCNTLGEYQNFSWIKEMLGI